MVCGVSARHNGSTVHTHRLDEESLVADSLTTSDDGGALLLTRLDVAHDSVGLELRDLGTLVRGRLEGVSDLESGGLGLEGLGKLVVDALLDVDSGTGTAGLTVVEAGCECGT